MVFINKKNNTFLKITAGVLLVIIVVLSFFFIKVLSTDVSEYKEIDKTQETLLSEVLDDKTDTDEINNNKDNTPFTINWNKLTTINKDIVAWIRIPGTNINYPVVQGETNDEYLRTNIYKKHSRGGVPFVDSHIENPFDCTNTIVYGHNLMNGAMFSNLKKYNNQSFANNHDKIYVYFPSGEIRVYQIYSFHTVSLEDKDIYNLYPENALEYKNAMDRNNKLNMNIDINKDTQILTLSTCTNKGEGRYVLHAVYDKNKE